MTHGTLSGYKSGCHCHECIAANRAYQNDWARRKRNGTAAMVAADEARRHVLFLIGTGMTASGIASAAGVSKTVVWGLCGNSKKLRRENADAVLGVNASTLPSGLKQWVPSHRAQPMVKVLREVLGHDDLERLLKIGGHEVYHQKWVQRVTIERARILIRHLVSVGRLPANVIDEVNA